jgi:phosphatidylglycerol:prolipoprotein diacylglycerol transferase
MFPKLIDIPLGFTTVPLNSFGIMVLSGFLAGLWVAGRRAQSRGLNPELITDLSVWLLLGGLLGARLVYVVFYNRYDRVLMHWEYEFNLFDLTDGGLHPLGGLAGFLLVLSLTWAHRRRARAQSGTPAGPADAAPAAAPAPPSRGWLIPALFALAGGLAGARALHIALAPSQYSFKIFAIWEGGIVFYGGFVGALAAGVFYLWRRRAPVLVVADVMAPSLALGMVFGRMGCFLKGCCFGAVTDLPWGIRFPQIVETFVRDGQTCQEITGSPAFLQHRHDFPAQMADATQSLPVHPVQAYESLAMLGLFALLSWYWARRPRPGRVLASLGIGYGLWRFLVEFLRGDPHPQALGLNFSQLVSLGVAAVAVLFWLIVPRGTAAGDATKSPPAPGTP